MDAEFLKSLGYEASRKNVFGVSAGMLATSSEVVAVLAISIWQSLRHVLARPTLRSRGTRDPTGLSTGKRHSLREIRCARLVPGPGPPKLMGTGPLWRRETDGN